MPCYICDSTQYTIRDGKCRDLATLDIYECCHCGLVYLSSFKHLDENYYIDNGQVESNRQASIVNTVSLYDTQRRFDQFAAKLVNKSLLDFGCGEGRFLHKLKRESITSSLYSLEINRHYFDRLSSEFNHFTTISDIPNNSLDYITMFHVMEHLADPLSVLEALYGKLKMGGKIIIEVPSADDILLKTYKNIAFSNFTYWSCHLYLFNVHTLKKLLKKTKYKCDYVTQYQRYGLANHLHWLSENKPGGHLAYSFLEDNLLNELYAKKLAEIEQCDTVIAEIQKV